MPRNIRKRRESSSSSSGEEEAATAAKDDEKQVDIKEKIEELKFLQKQREKNHGLDVYSLAIGDAAETAAKLAARRIENDPWKSKTGGLVDMREIREKRGNEIVRHMNSNFAKETNQRDEDAEMQKFIEQQLREIRGGSSKEGEGEGNSKTYKSPNDVIFDLSSHLLESGKKKGGDGFTEEILSGIPEVDLGIEERMRNIEETEKAKSTVAKQPQHPQHSHHHHHHHHSSSRKSDQFTSSVNFVQHKRFDETLINADKQRAQQMAAAAALNSAKHQSDEPVVGDAPKHELLQPRAATNKRKAVDNEGAKSSKPSRPHTSTAQPTERASDDYCLERFKKNMKFSRGSKIKIG